MPGNSALPGSNPQWMPRGGGQNYFDNRLVTRYGADPSGTRNSWQAFYDSIQGVSGNGFVVVPPGTYKVEGAPLVVPANVHIIGINGLVTLTRTQVTSDNDAFFDVQGNNVLIANLNFSISAIEQAWGINVSAGVTDLLIRDCNFNNAERAIHVAGTAASPCDRVTILRCYITHTGASAVNNRAIQLENTRYSSIEDCEVDGGSASDYQFCVFLDDVTELKILGSNFLNASASGIGNNSNSDVLGLTIFDCLVESCGSSGVNLSGPTGTANEVRDIRVSGCFLVDNGSHGLVISGSAAGNKPTGIVLAANIFKGNTQNGLNLAAVRNAALTANSYRQNGREGLLVTSVGGVESANVVCNGPNVAGNSTSDVTVYAGLNINACLGFVLNGGIFDGKDADDVVDPGDMSGVTQTGGSAIQVGSASDDVTLNDPTILNAAGDDPDIDIDATTTTVIVHRSGSGTPEASALGSVGSTYVRTDGGSGSTLYIKESGNANVNTGWAAVGGAANYMFATMDGDQTFSAAAAIEFDVDGGSNNITVDAATNIGRFTLPAGKVYILEAAVRFSSSSADNLSFRWHNVTDATDIGIEARCTTVTDTGNTTTQPVAMALIDATAEAKEVEIRMTGGSGNETISSSRTWAFLRSVA